MCYIVFIYVVTNALKEQDASLFRVYFGCEDGDNSASETFLFTWKAALCHNLKEISELKDIFGKRRIFGIWCL
jgi:hypothetical protein